MSTQPDPDLMTAEELADRLKVRPNTIRTWARRGRIPARRLSHKVVRYSLAAVLAALEGHGSTPAQAVAACL